MEWPDAEQMRSRNLNQRLLSSLTYICVSKPQRANLQGNPFVLMDDAANKALLTWEFVV